MKYFNYLDIDYKPAAEKLKKYLIEKDLIGDIKSAWRLLDFNSVTKEVPELEEAFRPLGLTIDMVGIFVTYYHTGVIHIDNDFRKCRINFPIMNCEDTVTNFYRLKPNLIPETISQNNGYKLHMFDSAECELADQMILTKAAIMRVLEPHQVVTNHTNFPRVSCTVAFKQDITYLLEE